MLADVTFQFVFSVYHKVILKSFNFILLAKISIEEKRVNSVALLFTFEKQTVDRSYYICR